MMIPAWNSNRCSCRYYQRFKSCRKEKEDCKVVVNGDGSASIANFKIIIKIWFKDLTICGLYGILSNDVKDLNWAQKEMAQVTNLEGKNGVLADAMVGADIFIGVSAPNIVTKEMVFFNEQKTLLYLQWQILHLKLCLTLLKAGASRWYRTF